MTNPLSVFVVNAVGLAAESASQATASVSAQAAVSALETLERLQAQSRETDPLLIVAYLVAVEEALDAAHAAILALFDNDRRP